MGVTIEAAIACVTFGIAIIALWWIQIWGKGSFATFSYSIHSSEIGSHGYISWASQRTWAMSAPFFGLTFISISLSYWIESKWLFIEFFIFLLLGILGVIWGAIKSLPFPEILRPHHRLSLVLEQRSATLLSTPLPLTLRAPRTYWPFVIGIVCAVFAFATGKGGAPVALPPLLWAFTVITIGLGIFMLATPETLVIGYEGLHYKGLGGEFFVRWSQLTSVDGNPLCLKLHGSPDIGRFRELVPSRFLVDSAALHEVILKAKKTSSHS